MGRCRAGSARSFRPTCTRSTFAAGGDGAGSAATSLAPAPLKQTSLRCDTFGCMGSGTPFASEFIRVSSESIRSQYWPRIKSCVESLSQEEVQWRPPDGSVPSIGDILRRLSEAVFRTIAALGSETLAPLAPISPGLEAGTAGSNTAEKLVAEIDSELKELNGVLVALSPEAIGERRAVGGRELTVMEVIMELSEELATSYGEISHLASVVSDYRPTCEH